MEAKVAVALPSVIATMKQLIDSPEAALTDFDVMTAWEADYTLFSHSTLLAESIAQDTLHITPPLALPNDRQPISPNTLQTRSELLQSMRNIQQTIRNALKKRVNSMPTKPRLYRLSNRLSFSDPELRAFVFIIITCAGLDGPPADERRQTPKPRSELFTCRQFANMRGHELLHFLSPSRMHFSQGLLEVDEEFAAMYTENRFRAPREVLKAIYGCTLTLDEAMTLGNSALASVLSEEAGSIQPKNGSNNRLSPRAEDSSDGRASASTDDPATLPAPPPYDRTTDNSAVLELLSELRSDSSKSKKKDAQVCEPPVEDTSTDGEAETETDAEPETEIANAQLADGDIHTAVEVYEDDMDYLKDGFEVVQEACKVYNFREKNSDEDRYTNTKRPVEALQREADAKLRKASAMFMNRLNKSKSVESFTPRLELLVDKLKLDHFERMVILTLGMLHKSHNTSSIASFPPSHVRPSHVRLVCLRHEMSSS